MILLRFSMWAGVSSCDEQGVICDKTLCDFPFPFWLLLHSGTNEGGG